MCVDFSLKGKTAIVTGCSTGLGQGICKGMAEAGAKIVGVDYVDAPETKEIIGSLGGEFLGIKANLLSIDQIKDKIKEAVEDFDDLDDLDDDFDDEDLDSLVSLLESNGAAGEKEADPDQFWEKASEEVVYDLNNPDIISYEQAEKLGLTPDDEA